MMGMFERFKSKRVGEQPFSTPPPTIDSMDWVSKDPSEGLPALASALMLTDRTWGFAKNADSKIEVLRDILLRVDAEDDLFQKLCSDPDADPRQVNSLEDLSEFGRSIVMLLFGVGNLASFLGGNPATTLRNTVEGEAAELRTIMLVDKAYEVWGERALIAACIETFIPMFSPKIDVLPEPESMPEDVRQVFADLSLIARHARDLFYNHYRPRRMADMSMRSPGEKGPLPMADMQARAMHRAYLAAIAGQ